MSQRLSLLTAAVATAILAGALAIAGPATAAGDASVPTLDREFALVTREIPGFGGVYYDRQGRLTAVLTDLGQAEALRGLNPDVRIVKGDYDFAQLAGWKDRLLSAFRHPGVVFVDADEVRNRVVLGVERGLALRGSGNLDREIARRGVPRGAVVIVEADPIHQLATLRDQIRPVPGGVQIHFSNFLCTLGFNATRGGVTGFVTNSHCTDVQGGVESTRYYQPLSPAAIGTETADPTYRRNIAGCPRGRRCRYSDSAFAAYDSGSLSHFARIARTTSRGNLSGSITIDSSNPTFTITSTSSSSVGQEVNKVGRTTGWTFGDVSTTCATVGVSGTNIVQICQDFVDAGVGGGDSGSPVFSWGGSSSVSLRGILWGGNSAGTLFVYSPFANVTRSDELGSLTVH